VWLRHNCLSHLAETTKIMDVVNKVREYLRTWTKGGDIEWSVFAHVFYIHFQFAKTRVVAANFS
jgi:hypothetical protein